jgi:anthranilate phosphoribosyltransferase
LTIISDVLDKLTQYIDLTPHEARCVALEFLSGRSTNNDMQQTLALLQQKGESISEILGFISAMRDTMTRISFTHHPLIDVCGTGGSYPNRFNVSTCVALVLGVMGYHVAKHGNRGSKKPNGCFDFLDALGIPYSLTPTEHQQRLRDHGATFLFAREYHPAVRHAASARAALPGRSIFNLIGPFCNPALPNIQIVGCPSKDLARTIMAVGKELNYDIFAVLASDVGLDECSTVGLTHVMVARNGVPEEWVVDPVSLGIYHDLADMTVSAEATARENAAMFKSILMNRQMDHPIATLIALNAGVIISIIHSEISLNDAFLNSKKALFSEALVGQFLL